MIKKYYGRAQRLHMCGKFSAILIAAENFQTYEKGI